MHSPEKLSPNSREQASQIYLWKLGKPTLFDQFSSKKQVKSGPLDQFSPKWFLRKKRFTVFHLRELGHFLSSHASAQNHFPVLNSMPTVQLDRSFRNKIVLTSSDQLPRMSHFISKFQARATASFVTDSEEIGCRYVLSTRLFWTVYSSNSTDYLCQYYAFHKVYRYGYKPGRTFYYGFLFACYWL